MSKEISRTTHVDRKNAGVTNRCKLATLGKGGGRVGEDERKSIVTPLDRIICIFIESFSLLVIYN